ncbi:MAG: hypothetical protein ACREYD_03465 [Casimicrobiaceae bacterium]
MPVRRALGGMDRAAALLLAVIWLTAAAAAIFLGMMHARWKLVVPGLFALAYAALWLRVVRRGRLLTCADLLMPWRRR